MILLTTLNEYLLFMREIQGDHQVNYGQLLLQNRYFKIDINVFTIYMYVERIFDVSAIGHMSQWV